MKIKLHPRIPVATGLAVEHLDKSDQWEAAAQSKQAEVDENRHKAEQEETLAIERIVEVRHIWKAEVEKAKLREGNPQYAVFCEQRFGFVSWQDYCERGLKRCLKNINDKIQRHELRSSANTRGKHVFNRAVNEARRGPKPKETMEEAARTAKGPTVDSADIKAARAKVSPDAAYAEMHKHIPERSPEAWEAMSDIARFYAIKWLEQAALKIQQELKTAYEITNKKAA